MQGIAVIALLFAGGLLAATLAPAQSQTLGTWTQKAPMPAVRGEVAAAAGKVPLAPLTARPFRCPLCPLGTGLTGSSDMGTPPSVARSLLAGEFTQATTKRHFEHS